VQCEHTTQIYNETIRDLLLPEGRGKPLDLREDTGRGMVIAGLSTHTPRSADEVFDLLARGNKNRSQCATDANSESSRSHGVFQIMVTFRDRAGGGLRRRLAAELPGVSPASEAGELQSRPRDGGGHRTRGPLSHGSRARGRDGTAAAEA
jgi:hypothetical protein